MNADRPRPDPARTSHAEPAGDADAEPEGPVDAEADTPADAGAESAQDAAPQGKRPIGRQARWGWGAAALCLAAVVTVVLVLVLRGPSGRSASAASTSGSGSGAVLADPDLATAYLSAVSAEIVAVTSYDYRRLDDARSAGLAVTTGSYRTAYRAALNGGVAAAARRDHIVQDFQVQRVGIGAVTDNGARAKVLVFGIQIRTTNVNGGSGRRPQTVPVVLTATVDRHGSSYLISGLDVGTNAGLPPGSEQLPMAAEAGREAILRRFGQPVTAVAIERATGSAVLMLIATGGQKRFEVALGRGASGWTATAITVIGSS